MAGIGFVLRRLTREDNLLDILRGYSYSAWISSGPFLFTVLSVAGINYAAQILSLDEALDAFRSVTIYNFALSLLLTSPLLLCTTRYLADMIYMRKAEEGPGMLIAALCLNFVINSFVVIPLYYVIADMTPGLRLAAVANYYLIASIWTVSVFLSALKDYKPIGYAFAGGMTVAFAGSILLGGQFGGAGMVIGFSLGLAFIFFWLLLRVFVEYPYRIINPFGFLGHFRRFWDLAVYGFAYNAAVWIDKLVMWLAPEATVSSVGLVTNSLYDGAMFYAQLTVVPAMAIFIVSIETDFFEKYQVFYRDIQNHATFRRIQENHSAIARSLLQSGRNILIMQLIITALVILLSPRLFAFFHLEVRQIGIFRIGALGAMFQVMGLFASIVLAYFDLRRHLMWLNLFYLALNGALTYGTLHLGFAFYGYGYFLASLITFVVAYLVTMGEVRRLPYLTFIKNNSSVN